MLLPDNIHPENSIYYNGAFILKILQDKKTMDLLELYSEVKNIKPMTFSIFILSLDWLFLINVTILNERNVELCS